MLSRFVTMKASPIEGLLDKLEDSLANNPATTNKNNPLTLIRVRDKENRTRHLRIEIAAPVEDATPVVPLVYRPPVFMVLSCRDGSKNAATVDAHFLTYNEERIEGREFEIASPQDIGRIKKYVTDRLVRMVFTNCPGVEEGRLLLLAANCDAALLAGLTLAEKFGDCVVYRSRYCARIRTAAEIAGEGALCPPCQKWLRDTVSEPEETESKAVRTEPGLAQVERELQEEEEEMVTSILPDQEGTGHSDDDFDHQSEDSKAGLHEHVETDHVKCYRNLPDSARESKVAAADKQMRKIKRKFKKTKAARSYVEEHSSSAHAQFPCPFQRDGCDKRFRVSLGKSMLKHLDQRHSCSLTAASGQELPPDVKAALTSLKEEANLLLDTKKIGSRVCGRRFYPCSHPNCDYVARDVTALRYHQPVHTGEMHFCCPTCGKSFRYKKELINCEKRHKGELDFLCDHCDKKFISKKKLNLHVRVHTGEKPFYCPLCQFRCSRQDNLNTHIKKHHGLSWREAERTTGISHKTGQPMGDSSTGSLLLGPANESTEEASGQQQQHPIRLHRLTLGAVDVTVTEAVLGPSGWL